MAALEKALFNSPRDLDSEEIRKLSVNNFSTEVGARLTAQGWSREVGWACIGLFLSPDNQLVDGGTFMVKGPVDGKQISIEADKIWPSADKRAVLMLRITDGAVFSFTEGGLTSDILARDAVTHSLVATADNRQPAPILESNYEEWGFRGFSLRMLCTISKKSSAKAGIIIKYTILLFPMDREPLLEKYELAQSAAWPGLRIAEGHLPLMPRAQQAWGCPVLPLLGIGADSGNLPKSDILRAAIASIMGRGVTPETGRSGQAVTTKWERLANNPEEAIERPGDVLWPQPAPATQSTGKKH